GPGPPPEVVHLDRLVGGSLGRIVLGEGDKRARGAEQAVQRLGRASEELGGERGELGGGVLDGERPVDPTLPRRELRRPRGDQGEEQLGVRGAGGGAYAAGEDPCPQLVGEDEIAVVAEGHL